MPGVQAVHTGAHDLNRREYFLHAFVSVREDSLWFEHIDLHDGWSINGEPTWGSCCVWLLRRYKPFHLEILYYICLNRVRPAAIRCYMNILWLYDIYRHFCVYMYILLRKTSYKDVSSDSGLLCQKRLGGLLSLVTKETIGQRPWCSASPPCGVDSCAATMSALFGRSLLLDGAMFVLFRHLLFSFL